MVKLSARPAIRLRGVRHNNLKNFDLDLPLNRLVVITGLSGSGKSSLAFDTLFAEGQRRYIETFSPYARQFFDRMDKPQVDSIEGIPPAIAIEQRNAVRTTRSTVSTMTEICDYMKMLWPHVAQLHCRQCGRLVRKDPPAAIWESETRNPKSEVLITFDLPLSEKLSVEESLALVAKQGYQRLLVKGEVVRLEDASSLLALSKQSRSGASMEPRRLGARKPAALCRDAATPGNYLTVVQDRLVLTEGSRARFVEACEQAYHFGKGKLAIRELAFPELAAGNPQQAPGVTHLFSNRLHCAKCDIEYRDPTPALFSFNHPVGACPACRGFGRIISIDYDLVLPDRTRTLGEGVVKPWQSGMSAECQDDLMRACRRLGVPTDVPFNRLAQRWRDLVIEGEPGYGKDAAHEWPHAWYGVKGYFRWLESKAYKMHVRVLLSRYRAYTPCADCRGQRFQPETLLYRCEECCGRSPKSEGQGGERRDRRGCGRSADFQSGLRNPTPVGGPAAGEGSKSTESRRSGGVTLADFYQMPIRDALPFIEALAERQRLCRNDPLYLVLNEVRARLGYLNQVGLGYLTLDRPTRTLSGGETERVNLTTCLGTRLVNTLFVLDEPSVGLHPRDTERLVRLLEQLRTAGNTVVVVEHEASVIRAADQVVDLGPGHGATGGEVVFQGTYPQLLKSAKSLTGQYLSGRRQIEVPRRRVTKGAQRLRLSHATRNNLTDLSVDIPLGRFVCVTGVSGSGKTTLVREILLPALAAKFRSGTPQTKAFDGLATGDNGDTEDGDSALGTPRSALLEGAEHLGRAVLVDQSILGKTPRSNPAVYIGAFDDIRAFFAQSEQAKQRGLNASAFSFNSGQGQCERCRGAGFEKIEMQFLSDVFIRCPDCNGRRYRSHILEVKLDPRAGREKRSVASASRFMFHVSRPMSIADLLESTVEEGVAFLEQFPESTSTQRAVASLRLLEEVGLGYLKLGQPINTLSGGESQRLKLVRHLAEVVAADASRPSSSEDDSQSLLTSAATLFLFDEPTTGLHFDDVRVLLKVFQRLVDAGHSVLVIEHNLEVMKAADWIVDLGPGAGDEGGRVVVAGTPEQVAASRQTHTGAALRTVLTS